MVRMREYGARRAERLWDSYEHQMTRIRTFSLQQRLRLMRQYKIKQRYLNKLVESLNSEASARFTLTRNASEQVVQEMINLGAADLPSIVPEEDEQDQHSSSNDEEEPLGQLQNYAEVYRNRKR